MRAEDLRVIMIEEEGGQGNNYNNKQHRNAETEVAKQNWWQPQLAQRDDELEWLVEIEVTKAIHWAHHNLNLNDI